MIKLVNVSKYYNSNNVVALGLRKVDLELYRNEFVAIVGESGSGKTTLLNVISGIDSYEDGEMYINGKETSYYSVEDMENYRKNYVAFVFQSYNLIESYTVLQNVEAPLILMGYPKEKIRERANEIIRKVGLEDHINHKATRLSGGQKQRVVIARALAKDCPIIAADEPTGNLDSKSAKQVIELLHEISKEKLVIMVTHDFSQVKDYATRKIRVYDGEIVEDLDLKKVDKLDMPEIKHEDRKVNLRDYLSISLRNLFAVPKKTILMLVVFTFFSFFVAITYGAYQLVLNETNINTNTTFVNANPNRIVVRKDDNSAFTQDDIDELEAYDDVVEIVSFDYILDKTIALYSDQTSSRNWIDGLFLPLSLIDTDDLEYGRLPENDNEIVIAVDQGYLRDYEDYLDITYSTYDSLVGHTYKIVGMIDIARLPKASVTYYESFFFGTDENLTALSQEYYLTEVNDATFIGQTTVESVTFFIEESLEMGTLMIDNRLPDNEIRTAKFKFYGECSDSVCYVDGDLTITDYYQEIELEDVTMAYDDSISEYNAFYVNETTYNQIIYDEIYQVSLLTDKEVGMSTLVRNIQRITDGPLDLKYHVAYPFDNEASQNFDALIFLLSSIGLIVLNVIVLVGSTLITYVIFRAIINTKLPDYAIFRTIGANKSVIKKFIYFENFYIVIGAYIIFLIGTLSLPLDLVINTPFYALKVFGFWNYLVFLGLLFIMSLIISRRYCNRIFSQTVQSTLKADLG